MLTVLHRAIISLIRCYGDLNRMGFCVEYGCAFAIYIKNLVCVRRCVEADSVVAQLVGYSEHLHSDQLGLLPLKQTNQELLTKIKYKPRMLSNNNWFVNSG